MAELSVFHSLRAIEHYLHFKPIARPLLCKMKSLGWQLCPLSATEAAADPVPAGQGCTRLLCCSAEETEGHGIVISVAVGNHHPVQCSCNYKPLTPFPLAGADVGLAQPRLPGSLVHWQPGWDLAEAAGCSGAHLGCLRTKPNQNSDHTNKRNTTPPPPPPNKQANKNQTTG